MAALVEQVKIDLAEQQPERIRVLGLLDAAGPGNPQHVRHGFRQPALEQPVRADDSSRPTACRRRLRTASTPSAPGKNARTMRPCGVS